MPSQQPHPAFDPQGRLSFPADQKTEGGGEHRNQKLCSSLGVVRKSHISSLISNVIVDKLFTNKY